MRLTDAAAPGQAAQLAAVLEQGGVIAYPTESVFGLGCAPDSDDALGRLLALKGRPSSKGMLVVCGDFREAEPYLDMGRVSPEDMSFARECWQGFCTLLFPAGRKVSPLLRGEHDTLGVRICSHPLVRELCGVFGRPLVSTSANLAGCPPCRTASEVRGIFGSRLDAVAEGATLGLASPSPIIDLRSRRILRN